MNTIFDEGSQFSKLNKTEQATCIEILERNPTALRECVERLAKLYENRTDPIEGLTLLKELINFFDTHNKQGI